MKPNNAKTSQKTIVLPTHLTFPVLSGTMLQVKLAEGETVEWQWTHLSNGQSMITGYNIIKKRRCEERWPQMNID